MVRLEKDKLPTKNRADILQKSYKHLRTNDIKGFCSLIGNVDLPSGTSAMLEVVGVGKIKPNILLIGFKNDWRVCDQHSLSQYFATIQSVFQCLSLKKVTSNLILLFVCNSITLLLYSAGFSLHVGVAILRVSGGLDYSAVLGDSDQPFHGGEDGRPPSIILETPPGTPDAERRNTISDSPFGTSNIAETSKDPKRTKKSKKNLKLL